MKDKIFLIIGLIVLLLGIPLGILLLAKPTIFNLKAADETKSHNVTVNNITDQSALVSWLTDKPTQASLHYGLNPENLSLVQVESQPATQHQIKLEGLLPQSIYFFIIKIGEKSFTDADQKPYQFTTLPRLGETQNDCRDENTLKAQLGREDSPCDLNKDGVVNSVDLFLFRQQNK
jgi:hypothetical protein